MYRTFGWMKKPDAKTWLKQSKVFCSYDAHISPRCVVTSHHQMLTIVYRIARCGINEGIGSSTWVLMLFEH